MAEDTENDDLETVDGDAEPTKKKLSGKKLVLLGVLPLVLLLGGGGAAVMMMSGGGDAEEAHALAESHDSGHSEAQHEEKPAEEDIQVTDGDGRDLGVVKFAGTDLIFFELPDMIVNLNTSGSQPRFLKIKVALEFGDRKIVTRLRRDMPRIIDHFQIYLRELRREDLRGSAGMYRLKEELMIRVNQTVQPSRIRDVLFKEMLVQ